MYRSGGAPAEEEPSHQSQIIAALDRQLAVKDEQLKKDMLASQETMAHAIEAHKSFHSYAEKAMKLCKMSEELSTTHLDLEKTNGELRIQLEQEKHKNLVLRNKLLDLAKYEP